MYRFEYPNQFENKLQVSYFQETLERSFLFSELLFDPCGASYKLSRKSDHKKAQIILANTFCVAVKMTVTKIFEKKPKVVFDNDVYSKLVKNGDVNEIGEGIYVFQGQFLKLMNFFDQMFKDFAISIQGIEQYYPTRWPIELFKDINYFEEFPQNILLVSGAKKDRDSLELLTRKYGKGRDFNKIELSDFLEPATTALGTSTCDPCYYIHKNGKLGKNDTYYALSKCFRNEKSRTNELDRLTEFSMREIIATGQEEYVKSQRKNFIEFIESFANFTGLACSLEKASDPFFTNEIPEKAALQNYIESKFELLVPLGNEKADLAVGSVNWHGDFFGRSFQIRDRSDYFMTSSCLAFGLERIVFAFLTQHGMDSNSWPSIFRKAFHVFELGGSDQNCKITEHTKPKSHDFLSNKEDNQEDLSSSKYSKDLKDLLIKTLNLDSSEEKWLSSRNTFSWDSLNHLKVISNIEETFDVTIPSEIYSELMDEQSLLAFLDKDLD